MAGKVIEGPVTIRGDLVVTGTLNKGLDTVQSNNGSSLQVIQGVLQPVVTQPNVVPQSGDIRMYGQNVTINGNVVPGGTDGYFQIDEYINGAWQHLFEVQPSTTGNDNVLDLFISGRVFARDSLLSAKGRFFFISPSTPFGVYGCSALAFGNGIAVMGSSFHQFSRSTDNGLTWSAAIANPLTGQVSAICYLGGNIFIAGDLNGNICRSTDGGQTWGALIANNFGSGHMISGFAYANNILIGMSVYGMSKSLDQGVTWSALDATVQGTALYFFDGVFILGNGNGTQAYCRRSTDNGQTWSGNILIPFIGTNWTVQCFSYGQGILLAGGNGALLARSTDKGLTWTLISTPFTSAPSYKIGSLVFGDGIFYAATSFGEYCRSLDLGLTWGIRYLDNSKATPGSATLAAMAVGLNNRIIAVGYTASAGLSGYFDYVEAGAGIVESGSNSNGSYIQFADGTMECWGSSSPSTAMTTAIAGWYWGSGTITYPVAFIALTPGIIEGAAGSRIILGAPTGTYSATSFGFYALDNVSETSTPLIIWRAVGRWK